MKVCKKIFVWVWCFPQMLAGLVLKLVTRAWRFGDHYHYGVKCGSISLGEYIFLCPSHWNDEETLKHEKGHTKQSYILGWLWLPLVGLPSMIWAGCFEWYRKKYNVSYYAFYSEKWADKLGGVNRC